MNHKDFCFTLMSIAAVVLLIAMFVCANQRDNLKKQAVERGYAEYNPTNGAWQWKEQTK